MLHKGQPLVDVEIDAGPFGSVLTDADGCFHFAFLREGTEYSVYASKQNFTFELGADSSGVLAASTEVTISATQLFNVSGVVRHNGRALAGVEIDGGALGTVTTDANGRYEFTSVPEGTKYSLTARKKGYALASKVA